MYLPGTVCLREIVSIFYIFIVAFQFPGMPGTLCQKETVSTFYIFTATFTTVAASLKGQSHKVIKLFKGTVAKDFFF